MRLGSLTLKSNLFLSPLAGYTNLPFRLALREIGGLDLATTDLVNARSLLQKNRKALKLIETRAADSPPAGQWFGSVPGEMPCEAAKMMFEETGCAGVSIGRGAFYNPWIFRHTRHFLDTGELPAEPDFDERVRVMCRHLDLMVEVFGEELGCRMFRKVAPWYSKRFGPVNEFNKRVVQVSTKAGFHEVLQNYLRWRQQFLDEHGELQPKFQPPPLVASFMQ